MQNKKTLAELAIGESFKIGDFEFVKFRESNGESAIIAKHPVFEMRLGESNDYRESDIKTRLENEILPIIEREIKAENVVKHELDLRALDGSDEYGKIHCKVSLPTLDFLRNNAELYKKVFKDTWSWTATPLSTRKYGWKHSVLCVSPLGDINSYGYDYYFGVRPFCILKSNIFVSS